MKKIFFVLVVLLPSTGQAQNIYYVQDVSENANASDSNAGTDINYPWASWQKAFDTANAGDTVYFREGTWYLGPGEIVTYDPDRGHGNSGMSDNWINFVNYPGEIPILDGSDTTDYEDLFEVWHIDYVLFKGLVFQGKQQKEWNQIIRQVSFYENGTIQIENCVSRNSGGYGFTINGWDTLFLYNNDSYEHSNPMSDDPGNKPDGFAIASGGETTDYGEVIGNRAWRCSDDGMEYSPSTSFILDRNWMFCNGYLSGGAGVGIKYGKGYIEHAHTRITQRCIAAWNKGPGYAFQNLHHPTNGPIGIFYNNLSYGNNLGFASSIGDWDCATGDTYLNFQNNISYNNTMRDLNLVSCQYPSSYEQIGVRWFGDHNTWEWADNSYLHVHSETLGWSDDGEDSQWVLLPDNDTTLAILSAPRNADGSLPDIGDAFKLSPTSDLIDVGIDVGIPFSGEAPDLGPFEFVDETCESLGGICCAPGTTCNGTSLSSSDCYTTCCNGACDLSARDGGPGGDADGGESHVGDSSVAGCTCGTSGTPLDGFFLLVLGLTLIWRRQRLRVGTNSKNGPARA